MKKYILYAEDDQDDFMLLKKAFEDVNGEIELINVPTGYDVINYLQELDESRYPLLILMDINMPMLDGKETWELLKIDDKFKSIPVVFFSTSANPKDKSYFEKGGSEFLTKPSVYSEWLTIANKLASYYCFLLFCGCELLIGLG